MTDEEIIIDGINVFKDYQDRKIEENANLMKKLDIANKKLAVFSRELEQANKENENLKEENAISREFLNQYQEEANALKSHETYKVWLNNEYRKENEKLKSENFTFEELIKTQEELIDKYKQALGEIEKYCTYMNTFNKYNKTNKGLDIDEILNIINEAKEQ